MNEGPKRTYGEAVDEARRHQSATAAGQPQYGQQEPQGYAPQGQPQYGQQPAQDPHAQRDPQG